VDIRISPEITNQQYFKVW